MSVDSNCGIRPKSNSETITGMAKQYAANSAGGISQDDVKRINAITDLIDRLAAINEVIRSWKVNSKGEPFPLIVDPRTGELINPPPDNLEIVPKDQREIWNTDNRGDFIAEWYARGYSTPEGGRDKYEIHHIIPLEYGGDNSFENLFASSKGYIPKKLDSKYCESLTSSETASKIERGGNDGKKVLTEAEVPGGSGAIARRENGWAGGKNLRSASHVSQRMEAQIPGKGCRDFHPGRDGSGIRAAHRQPGAASG